MAPGRGSRYGIRGTMFWRWACLRRAHPARFCIFVWCSCLHTFTWGDMCVYIFSGRASIIPSLYISPKQATKQGKWPSLQPGT